jgi:hypothetical protein
MRTEKNIKTIKIILKSTDIKINALKKLNFTKIGLKE